MKIQKYFGAREVSDETIKEVFQYRTHMLDFHQNYKGHDETKYCPLCKSHPDSQDSVEDCLELAKSFSYLKDLKRLYEDDFEEGTMTLLHEVMKVRKSLMNESQEQNSRPV